MILVPSSVPTTRAGPALTGLTLLAEVRRLLDEADLSPVDAVVQLVGNVPRLSTRRAEAERGLSDQLGGRVSVIAATTDGLGFSGRGEGFAAFAVCVLVPAARA